MNGSFFKSAAIGLVAAVAALLLLAAVGAFAADRASDPDKLITPVAYAALAVASVVGGTVSARIGGAGLSASAVCGAMLSIVHLAVHLALGGQLRVLPLIATYAGIVALSFIGGALFGRRRIRSASNKLRKLRRYSRRAR